MTSLTGSALGAFTGALGCLALFASDVHADRTEPQAEPPASVRSVPEPRSGIDRALMLTEADVARGVLLDALVVIDTAPGAGRGAEAASPADAFLSRDDVVERSETLFDFADGSSGILGDRRYRLIRLLPGNDAIEVAAKLSRLDGVVAEPVMVGRQMSTPRGDRPNDPLYAQQYALENVGQTVNGVTGRPAADIGVVAAWERQTGSPDVTIAVIDAGVSSTHPDLYEKLVAGYNIFGPDHTNTDALYNAHGTQVAGVAAAASNNDEGVTGVSWGSKIMPVVAANVLGFTSDAWLAEGLIWAVDNGADIAVLSFGLANPSTVLQDALLYAELQGVAVFASAGNTGEDRVFYPAAYSTTIAVGATDSRDELAPFSNRGPEVDVVAPGVNIFTCYHTVVDPDTYVYATGTSVATPMAAGVAALLLSADPGLSPAQIRSAIVGSARDLGDEGVDPGYGAGALDARGALSRALGETTCRADVNGDGLLTEADFTAWVASYNSGSLRADQNSNGLVDPGDFTAFISNFRVRFGCSTSTEADI